MMNLMEKMKQQLDQWIVKVDNLASKQHTTGQEVEVTGDPVPFTSLEEVDRWTA